MLAQADIVRTLLAARMRISASAWVIVHDTQVAEDIFQDLLVLMGVHHPAGGDSRGTSRRLSGPPPAGIP